MSTTTPTNAGQTQSQSPRSSAGCGSDGGCDDEVWLVPDEWLAEDVGSPFVEFRVVPPADCKDG